MVILVDENDAWTGTMQKLEAHKKGALHRAFSVFIFNTKGELLLQRRALGKYHSGGLWTNTCCSHPRPGEETGKAAAGRLMYEMGITAPLEYLFTFMYRSPYENGLTEHEVDHVFMGITDSLPRVHPEEVAEYKYMPPEEIKKDMEEHPGNYSSWFRIIIGKIAGYLPAATGGGSV